MLNVGDKVIYMSGWHGSSKDNPLRGSRYFCEGTVISTTNRSGLPICVKWDNGTRNSYRASDLKKVVLEAYLPEDLFSL